MTVIHHALVLNLHQPPGNLEYLLAETVHDHGYGIFCGQAALLAEEQLVFADQTQDIGVVGVTTPEVITQQPT